MFESPMAPLWWGYCSGCVLGDDGPVPDFLTSGPTGQGIRGGIGGGLILRHSGTNDTQPRLGPKEAQLYLTQSQLDNGLPIAMIRPEATVTKNGTVFVTKWSFTRYRTVATTKSPNKAPEPLEKFEVELTKFGVEQTSESFIPPMTGSTEVQDYRFQRMEDYLTDHWLNTEDATELLRQYR